MTYFIKTFGCAANTADSQRVETVLRNRGMKKARSLKSADYVVINTCMVRESAENRVYGLLNNLTSVPRHSGKRSASRISKEARDAGPGQHDGTKKVVLTGCLVGMAVREPKMMKRLKEKFPMVNEFLPIEEVGFETKPVRSDKTHALVPISNGCNNFCSYCVVPFTRGREVSRPYSDIIDECKSLMGFKSITLLGQNVNSYGADFAEEKLLVTHMGRKRVPTLFPKLLEEVAKMGFEKVDFMSSNPWDFTDELIDVIARNQNITRDIHLPVQSGDDEVLRKMNRHYLKIEYLKLIENLKFKIENLRVSTDIIVGFPGETEEQFQNTVDLCKQVGFYKAFISEYSPRPLTAASKIYKDDVPHAEKKRRWEILERLINTSLRGT